MRKCQFAAEVVLCFLVAACVWIQPFVRAISSGGAGALGAILGFLFPPFGPAIGAFTFAALAYLINENSAMKDFAEHIAAQRQRQESTEAHVETFMEHAERFTVHAIVTACLIGLVALYFRNHAFRSRVKSVATAVAGFVAARFKNKTPTTGVKP